MRSLQGSRLLCVLPQNPFDPCSGAARSVRTICELLAKNGVNVHCLAMVKGEGTWKGVTDAGVYRGVAYGLFDDDANLEERFYSAMEEGCFDLMLGFGGSPADIARYKRAERFGVKTVFALRNHGYLEGGAGFFSPFSGILTPSRYLSNVYSASLGVQSTAIPPLVDLDDVLVSASSNTGSPREAESVRPGDRRICPDCGQTVTLKASGCECASCRETIYIPNHKTKAGMQCFASGHGWKELIVEKSAPDQAGMRNEAEAKYFTVINAGAPEKGRRFMERLGPELVKRGIPLLLVEGRGGRFDCPGAVWMDPVAQPKEIYPRTKVLLVPSLWQEPAGRVVIEAGLNGIPSIGSMRGGMGEMHPTYRMAISDHLTEHSGVEAVADGDIHGWIRLIESLHDNIDDGPEYAAAWGKQFHPDVLGPRYLEYFEGVLNA